MSRRRRSGDTPIGETIKMNPRNEEHSKNSKAELLGGMGSEEVVASCLFPAGYPVSLQWADIASDSWAGLAHGASNAEQ